MRRDEKREGGEPVVELERVELRVDVEDELHVVKARPAAHHARHAEGMKRGRSHERRRDEERGEGRERG